MGSDSRTEPVLGYGVLLMAVTHVFIHVFDRVYPALFPVFREEFSLTLPQLGLIASIPPLFRTLASIPSGYIADRFGSRAAIALSFLIQISSALAVVWSKSSLTLFIAIGTLALASTIYHPAALSYTTKLTSDRERSKAIGVQSAGGPLGMALGPISLSLLIPYGWRTVYLLWFIPISLLFLGIWRLRPDEEVIRDRGEKRPQEKSIEQDEGGYTSLLSLGFVVFLVYSAVRNIGGRLIGSFLPLYLTDVRRLSVSLASLVFGSVSIMGVFAAPLGGLFADRFGNKRWLLTVLSASILCLSLAFLSPNAALFTLFYFGYSFFNSCGMAANSSIIAELTPTSRRGMGYALFFLPSSIVGSVAPMIGGFLADWMGLSSLFPLSIAIILASLLLLKFGVKV
ncbi:MFS transporter [Candidatus Bathyarchaeota archaeon]|nr:MAG: MFS transporter [Candidatus Bathyarchaeota archaeon]